MNNNIVQGICLWFQRLQITTMRFDFCGSQIGRGYRQVQQVQEAAKFMLGEEHLSPQERLNEGVVVPKYILLVGYSYGSIISASASASIPTCIGVVSIAPPLAVRHWLYVFHGNYHLEQAKKRQDLPRLMVIGSEDNFTSEEIFQEVVKAFPENSTTGAINAEKHIVFVMSQLHVAHREGRNSHFFQFFDRCRTKGSQSLFPET